MTDPSGPPPGSPGPAPGDAASHASLPIPAADSSVMPDVPGPALTAGPVATFSLEGRAAPALYLVGWVGSVMGLGVVIVSFLASGGGASPWIFLAGLVVMAVGLVAAGGSQAIERGRREDLAYRGPSPVLAFIAVIVLTLIATVLVLAPLSAAGFDVRSPAATTVSLAITMVMYVAVIRLLVVGPGALAWADMGLHLPASTAVRDLLLGAALAVPVLLVTLILGGLLSRFLPQAPSALPEPGDGLGLVANLVSAAILAPIGEELFFRGFTTTAWARTFGPRQAIVRGAVFFAIAHVVTLVDASFVEGAQRALFSFIALLPVGLSLGWLFLARRSLYASIGMHSAFNAIQVIVVFAAAARL